MGQHTNTPGGGAELAGRAVARVGFGAMQLDHAEPDEARAILRQATAAGVNHIDTAHFYGNANALIRDALTPYPEELVLVTKVGAVRGADGRLVPAQRPEQLREQVEQNLAVLGVDHVAVVNLRRLDTPPGMVAEGDQLVEVDDQLAELARLRDAGTIGGIGLSGVSEDTLRRAIPAGIACVQNLYSVLDRSAEPLLDLCREHGIPWVPFFPLGSGFPNRPHVTKDPAIAAVAADVRATPAQVALAWLLAHYDRTLLIPGTASPAHLAENIAAGSLRLPEQAIATLDKLSGQ